MQIYVTRVDAHRYSTLVERDGVRLQVPGYGFMRALPHDLAHFVVEGSLGLNRDSGVAWRTEPSSAVWRARDGENPMHLRKQRQQLKRMPTTSARPSG